MCNLTTSVCAPAERVPDNEAAMVLVERTFTSRPRTHTVSISAAEYDAGVEWADQAGRPASYFPQLAQVSRKLFVPPKRLHATDFPLPDQSEQARAKQLVFEHRRMFAFTAPMLACVGIG
jgi:hypothetical protein